MTLSTTATSVAYTGNGVTTAFSVPFAFFGTGASAELEVIERVIATGAETVKTVTTHYTVTGGSGSTGTVTATSAPASTVEWHIRRKTTKTQATAYVTNDPFPASSHEAALDRIVAQVQEVADDLANRAPLLDKTEDQGPLRIIVPTSTGQAVVWTGSGLDTLAPSDFPLQDYVDDASGFASVAASEASDAAGSASAAAASAASASGHDAAASTSASNASTSATNAANSASGAAVSAAAASADEVLAANHRSVVEAIATSASALDALVDAASGHEAAAAASAAAASADQVLVANDKSATAVLVATGSGYATAAAASAASASGHDTSAAAYAQSAADRVAQASGYATSAAAYAQSAADRVADASGYATTAAAHVATASGYATTATTQATNAGNSASAAADSATQAANAVGGLTFIFDDATTQADPGNGEFRLNNATPGSATELYIDNLDDDGGTVTGWLDSWDDSTNTNKGILLLKGLDEPLAFLMARVTAVADSTGYRTVTISVLASGGSFILGDRFMAIFAPAGDKGADGAGAGDVLGAGSGVTNKFAMWVNGDTITAADISAEDIVNFSAGVKGVTASDMAGFTTGVKGVTASDLAGFATGVKGVSANEMLGFSGYASLIAASGMDARAATKGDIFQRTGSDFIPAAVLQSAADWVTVTPRSGNATMDIAQGVNFRWFPNANVTLNVVGEKTGAHGMIEILRSGSEAVTFQTEFDAANLNLTGTDYLIGYHVLSADDIILLPGGPHV